jgi:hypothetical protein
MTTFMDVSTGAVAVAFGLFAAASPAQAARLWAAGRLDKLTPQSRVLYLRWYRIFGIVLCLGGAMLAVDSLTFR